MIFRSVKAVLPVFCLLYTCFIAMPGAVSASTENQAPVSIGTSPVLSLMSEGAAATVDLCAYFGDPDGDTLTFAAWTDNSSVVSLSRAENLLTITPKVAGSAQVTVRATDPDGLQARQHLSITVSPSEAAPPEATTPPEETTPTPAMEDAATTAVPTVTMGPDLVVDSIQAGETQLVAGEPVLEAGADFRVDVIVRNQGTAVSGQAAVRFYQSSDETITMADTRLQKTKLKAVAVDGTRSRLARFTAPQSPGVYYYGVCIESVENEVNTENNCSSALKITVIAPTGAPPDTTPPTETIVIPTTVDFPDSHLALKVREALKIPAGTPIPGAQVATLTKLDASAYEKYDYQGVVDVTGLEYAQNLTHLELVNSRITDFTPLSGLTRLESLDILGSAVTDLSPFKALTGLKAFYFDGAVSDFTPLAGLTQLEYLGLIDVGITDHTLPSVVASLAGLKNLKHLDLIGSNIQDVTPLAALVNLEGLQIVQDAQVSPASLAELRAQNPGLVISGTVAAAPANTTFAAAVPDETQLLSNYPNPFNPETWIPYELSTDTEVTLTIYNAQGVVVRVLHLGQQAAGYYTDRERAAYWDGRNSQGERVASGIYFYQLETDEMSSLRKMVILK